jgi:uncharacterized protein YlxW (UPF0749 family)
VSGRLAALIAWSRTAGGASGRTSSAATGRVRDREGFGLGAVVAVAGFGLVTLAFSTSSVHRAVAPRQAELITLISARKHQVDDLDAAARNLRSQVDQAQAAAGRLTATEQQQASVENALSLQAGAVAMSGPALVVNLADSTRHPADLAQASAYRIHDVDLQLVVNALFAAGAEAVAVNGDRVVATTPIRAAGQTIVVNFRPLNPPYVVQAIGADRTAFEGSDIAKRFRRWTSLFGLGYSVHRSDHVVLPAYNGQLALTTATPTQLLGPLGLSASTTPGSSAPASAPPASAPPASTPASAPPASATTAGAP